MADFDNGLPPVSQAEGSISSISFNQEEYPEAVFPQIKSISLGKEVYIETDETISSISSVSYSLNDIGYNAAMYL
ncbi:hypothetical protein [Dysgonomonas sp. 25]|uniref:hypothetical protein n=1 Tax=Dysgonomonas sp. 25 TaxID=2302933 RepID=UPI0013D7305D|nr:hypothetical protein [Dysgonomonas sp. 25]NDV69275.1 hypothetical protein [Dysgonomonas sp. 25]